MNLVVVVVVCGLLVMLLAGSLVVVIFVGVQVESCQSGRVIPHFAILIRECKAVMMLMAMMVAADSFDNICMHFICLKFASTTLWR